MASHEAKWRYIPIVLDLLGVVIEHDQSCLDALKKEQTLLAPKTYFTREESVLEMLKQRNITFQALQAKKMPHNGVDLPLLSTEFEPSTSTRNDTLEPATPDNVVNLSSVTLLDDELSTLFKGLSFSPSSGRILKISHTHIE